MLPSGLPETVGDDEDLARFLTQRGHFNQVVAKPAAFLPSSKSQETSVSRHGAKPTETLWQLGSSAAGDRTLYGAAIFKAAVAKEASLTAIAVEPPERHAVLRNWFWDANDPELQKSKQIAAALILVSKADLVLR